MDESPDLTPQTYVQQTAMAIWENLPKVVIAGLAFFLAATPSSALAVLGLPGPALLIAVFTIAPAWTALLAFESALAEGRNPRFRLLFDALVQFLGDSIRLGIFPLPFALGCLWLLPGLSQPSVSPVLWAGLLICVGALTVLLTLYLYAFPLIVQHEMTYGVALRNSALLASRHAANSVGLLSLGVLCALAAGYFSLALLFFLPALYGMFVVNNCRLVVGIDVDRMTR